MSVFNEWYDTWHETDVLEPLYEPKNDGFQKGILLF